MDIVIIATPIHHHAEQTIESLESGKHVLCEQTAAYTVGQCAPIVEAVKRTGRTYMMAENYCYFHYIRQWHDLVRQGKLGGIFYAEAEHVHEIEDLPVDRATGAYHWRHERPPIWYCAQCLGPLLMLMDDRIVQACGSHGGHGTSEYYLIRDFLDAVETGSRPPIDVRRAMDFTVPGIVAHDSAMGDGNWQDVPLFDW